MGAEAVSLLERIPLDDGDDGLVAEFHGNKDVAIECGSQLIMATEAAGRRLRDVLCKWFGCPADVIAAVDELAADRRRVQAELAHAKAALDDACPDPDHCEFCQHAFESNAAFNALRRS